jgi:parvulin-like peptidyl-prolyl isomerase
MKKVKKMAFGGALKGVGSVVKKAVADKQILNQQDMAKKAAISAGTQKTPGFVEPYAKGLGALNQRPVNDFLKRNNAPSMEKLNAAKQALSGKQQGQQQVGGLRPYTSSMGDAVFKSLKPSGPSLGSGPTAKANPLQKIGSGPSRTAQMKKGGKVSSASKRADGCAVKGKTKGRMV